MKNTLILILLLLFGMHTIKAELSFLDSIRPLKVGDKVPDILMGEVANYFKKEMRVSDFKGKILILDFWSTGCPSCMNAFPKMELIQEQFPEEIQIVLANARQSKEVIKDKLGEEKSKSLSLSLPIISDAKLLGALFPHIGVPHHVWIDKDGIVRLMGSDKNTHPKKIQQLLNGDKIEFLNDVSTSKPYNMGKSYEQQSVMPVLSTYSSFVTGYNSDFSPWGIREVNILDTIKQTRRTTFLNMDVLKLYSQILDGNESWSNKVVGPNYGARAYFDPFILKVKDSLNYSIFFDGNATDEAYMQSRYCYEQVYDASFQESERKSAMLRDLNYAFEKLHGAKAEVVKRIIPCYYLVRIGWEKNYLKKMEDLSNIGDKLDTKIQISSTIERFYRANSKKAPFVFDKTEFHAAPLFMKFKEWKKGSTFEDLIADLNKYGFDLIEGAKQMDMILILEN